MVAEQVVRDIGFEKNQNTSNHEEEKYTTREGVFETSEKRGLETTGSKIRGAPSTLGFESRHGSSNREVNPGRSFEENLEKNDEPSRKETGFEEDGLERLRQELRIPCPDEPTETTIRGTCDWSRRSQLDPSNIDTYSFEIEENPNMLNYMSGRNARSNDNDEFDVRENWGDKVSTG